MERDWQLKDCGEKLVELRLWWIERDCPREDCGERLAIKGLW